MLFCPHGQAQSRDRCLRRRRKEESAILRVSNSIRLTLSANPGSFKTCGNTLLILGPGSPEFELTNNHTNGVISTLVHNFYDDHHSIIDSVRISVRSCRRIVVAWPDELPNSHSGNWGSDRGRSDSAGSENPDSGSSSRRGSVTGPSRLITPVKGQNMATGVGVHSFSIRRSRSEDPSPGASKQWSSSNLQTRMEDIVPAVGFESSQFGPTSGIGPPGPKTGRRPPHRSGRAQLTHPVPQGCGFVTFWSAQCELAIGETPAAYPGTFPNSGCCRGCAA